MKSYKIYAYRILVGLIGDKKKDIDEFCNSKFVGRTNKCLFVEDDVAILGMHGICITNKILITPFALKKTILTILSRHYKLSSFMVEYLRRRVKFRSDHNTHYDRLFHLVARHGQSLESPNYAHWILENLPMVYLYLRESHDTKLLIRANSPSWVYDTLYLLGVEKKDIVETRKRISCNQLLYGHIPYIHSYSFVRSRFLRNWVSSTHKKNCMMLSDADRLKIFISRQSSRRRKITNFSDIKMVLKKYGFFIVDPNELSIEEQVSLFDVAECVIAQSGASLANMIYMEKNTKVIEITSFNHSQKEWCWKLLANEMQLDYTAYEPEVYMSVHSDITIDVIDFECMIKNMLLRRC